MYADCIADMQVITAILWCMHAGFHADCYNTNLTTIILL